MIKISPFLITFIAAFLIQLSSLAATYYVDASGGNDSKSGLTPADAWRTIAKVNSSVFIPGDNILFKRGGTWYEQLNFPSSGSPGNPIIIGAYDTGEKPIISGADLLTGFLPHTLNVWKKNITQPEQVFFNQLRGFPQTSVFAVNSDKDWFYDGSAGILYIYCVGDPAVGYTFPGIRAAVRPNCIFLQQDYINIENLQLEKTTDSGIKITSFAQNITIDNITLYQWTTETNWEGDSDPYPAIGGIDIYGPNCEIKNSTLGMKTGDDLADQNWAGFVGIHVSSSNTKIHHNNLYHSSTENESSFGNRAFGIRLSIVKGVTEVHDNYIYHLGSHGILVRSSTVIGDTIKLYNNTIEYPGQAGISTYITRGQDGKGGVGHIYGNHVSFANRLGGDRGAGNNQASGIHMNDGNLSNLDASKPFMRWYIYDNIIHNNQAIKKPNGNDSDGIGLDFNANGVEVYRNLIFNNWGKGLYMWNANRNKIYYNIIYGNDAGTTVTAANGTVLRADSNQIYNNTYYKNYNTNAHGPNYHTEIYFGGRGNFNLMKNNIFFGHDSGVVYTFRDQSTTGCITDNNVIFKNGGNFAYISEDFYYQSSFAEWRAAYPQWDGNSLFADPQFVDIEASNFRLKATSPAINRGINLGFTSDFYKNPFVGAPDVGAIEFQGSLPPSNPTVILINAMTGTLSGDARLGSMTGQKNTRSVYFQGPVPGATYTLNITEPGEWFVWARMYYMSSGGKNSFFVSMDGTQYILGDNDSKYNQWHWDGYLGSKLSIGTLAAGTHTLRIWGREPGLTLWVDQVILTNDPNYVPSDTQFNTILLNAMTGTLSGDARLGTMTGQKSSRSVYFQGPAPGVTFNINIPQTGQYFAWARMYYMSSGGKNSFFMSMNGTQYIFGDDDSKYNQWHWDGYLGAKINLGTLTAGNNILRIWGREPGLTLWVDQIVLTTDPNYNPNTALGKEDAEPELAETNISVPDEFELSQNYPNPFNPATKINYALPVDAFATIKIYDVIGNEVAVLINEFKTAARYEVNFDASNLSSGIYYYSIKAGDFNQVKKMILLK